LLGGRLYSKSPANPLCMSPENPQQVYRILPPTDLSTAS
jgi:hypothetical protein